MRRIFLLAASLVALLAISNGLDAQTAGWEFPTTASVSVGSGDNGKILSSENVPGASITVTLPTAASVGAGWEMGFSTAGAHGIIVNAPLSVYILAGQKSLTSFSAPSNTNYEYFTLQSDGTNFRLLSATDATVRWNGLTGAAGGKQWTYLFSSGYSATLTDNGTTLTSAFTGGNVTITLPSTPLLPNGWAIGLYPDGGNSITIQKNSVSGGTLIDTNGNAVSSFTQVKKGDYKLLSFDGSSFRVLSSGIVSGCPSIESFGGSGGGATDNSAALAALIASSPAGQICVKMSAGTYEFNSAIAYSVPNNGSFTVLGGGMGQTRLLFPATDGFDFQFPNGNVTLAMSGISMLSGSAGGHVGISLNGTGFSPNQLVNLTQVEFRGADGYGQTDYWSTGVLSHLVSNVTLTNTAGWGSGSSQGIIASVAGDQPTTTFAVVYNFINPNYNDCAVGIEYGGYAQGVNVIGGNFVNCLKGIYVPPGGTGNAQLTVTGAQFGLSTNDVSIEDDVGTDILITNNFFVYNSTTGPMTGILLQDFINTCTISSNIFGWGNHPNATGIEVTNVSYGPCNITSNTFYNLNLGIWLTSTSGNIQVTNTNDYAGNTTNLLNQGNNGIADTSPYGGGIVFAPTALELVSPTGGSVSVVEGGMGNLATWSQLGHSEYAADGSVQFNVFSTIGATDYLGITAGAGTGATMEVGSATDANANMFLTAKGTGSVNFYSQATLDGYAAGGALHSANGVNCSAGTVNLATYSVADGIVTHC